MEKYPLPKVLPIRLTEKRAISTGSTRSIIMQYKTWKNIEPEKEHGLILRNLWSTLRRKDEIHGTRIREFHRGKRRDLAHDYWLTKKL